jgi:hypothetical protein
MTSTTSRSKIVQRWLGAHPRLLVLHGARYSSHDKASHPLLPWGAAAQRRCLTGPYGLRATPA